MEFTDKLSYPCPSPEDLGALPLYMQQLALRVDGELAAAQAQFEVFRDEQPTAVWTNSGVSSTMPNVTAFTGYSVPLLNQFWNNPDFAVPSSVRPPSLKRGWYHLGMTINVAPVGAVDVGSHRIFRVIVNSVVGEEFTTIADFRDQIRTNGVAGGDWLNFSGTYENPTEGSSLFDFEVIYQYISSNTSSALQIPAGGWRFWITYVGTGDLVTVI